MNLRNGPCQGYVLAALFASAAIFGNEAVAQETTGSCIRAYMLEVKNIGRELQGGISDCKQAPAGQTTATVGSIPNIPIIPNLPNLPDIPNLPNLSNISQCMLTEVNAVQDLLAQARSDFDECVAGVTK